MSYKNLEVWQLAREVVIEIHSMSLLLPKFEMFEEGQQIRRSSKTVKALWKAMEEEDISKTGLSSLFIHFHQMMKH